ncbi:YXWGXW repeat-containing protein [Pseudomonas sp. NFACC02]|uniref:YXWGXW repeat-containing protein n=1 Tax=Pseudomonas TaxID=286 RepID=UPI000784DF80|nr:MULTISPECIES: YXWGXW repeat-containing protein [Pseudomonas]SEQ45391.1 YXWGXW repeat-containing protein [Pseudomonas sp. NFACC02]
MYLRYLVMAGVLVMATGCVEERVVHERRGPPSRTEYVEVIAPQAPPERIIEEEPAPRPGYIWSRAYWRWNGNRYVPVHGHWEAVRPGYRYQHPYWESRGDGWHYHVGVWVN